MPFYAYIVNNRVTFHTAYLASIVKNQPGGQRAYNIYLLTDKNYRLSRSKGILGSVLSSKEISQFDVKAINDRSSENDKKDSYKDYSHLELKKLTPEITEKGRYHLDPISGKIVKARLTKKEIVHPQLLHATINYELTNE